MSGKVKILRFIEMFQKTLDFFLLYFMREAQNERNYTVQCSKGQLISKCLFAAIVSTKNPTNSFKEFLTLKRGQIKKIKALYFTN